MILKCLLVDDEPLALEVLKKYIANIEYLELVDTCPNAFKAMEVLKTQKVDLVFLDIHMPKIMGTTFLRTLQNPPRVIFTTAYKEYAVEAFDLDAVDYLLKPISFERLLKAVNKLVQPNGKHEEQRLLPETASGFTYFRADRKMVKIYYDDIIYVESLKDYIKIFRTKGPPLVVKQSISTTEEILPDSLFCRVHRSYIISLDKISAITNHDVEIEKTEIPIGRMYRQQFQDLIDNKAKSV
jgi:two-component system, LytTR family, response regulator